MQLVLERFTHLIAFNCLCEGHIRSPAIRESHATTPDTLTFPGWTRPAEAGAGVTPVRPAHKRRYQLQSGRSRSLVFEPADLSRVNPEHRTVVFCETSCEAATRPVLQFNLTVDVPVVLEFWMRVDSGFVRNNCSLLLRAPAAKRVSLVLLKMGCHVQGAVEVIDSFRRRASWWYCVRHVNPGVDWVSAGNTARMWIEVPWEGLFVVRINAMALTGPEPGTIQTRPLSPTTGYIQNAGIQLNWPAVPGYVPVKTNAWSHLTVPGHNVVLISVPIAGLGSLPPSQACEHRVELYEGSMNRTVWRLCSRYRSLPQPHISHGGVVHVHFVSDWRDDMRSQGIGFRFIYSFYDSANTPTRLANGKWNCSSPTWKDFRQHFYCDLVTQCAGAEDEFYCHLYYPCGVMGANWHGKCYSLNKLAAGTTWHRANAECSNLGPGGRLAPQSRDIFHFMAGVLRHDLTIYSGHAILEGVQTYDKDSHLSGSSGQLSRGQSCRMRGRCLQRIHRGAYRDGAASYQHLNQRTDNTIMYRTNYARRVTFTRWMRYYLCDNPTSCSTSSWRSVLSECTRHVCYAFCETDTRVVNPRWVRPAYRVSLPDTNSSSSAPQSRAIPFPHVVCDRQHVTHAFLAYDQKTRCLRQDAAATTASSSSTTTTSTTGTLTATFNPAVFCESVRGWLSAPACRRAGPATASLVAARFACRSQAQRVHYTLVCDHRQDCEDDSDEDFCSFPPCDPHVHFQCETRQECHPLHVKCNHQPDCLDASDEGDCESVDIGTAPRPVVPFIVDLAGRHGWHAVTNVRNATRPYCPDTHYLCPSDGNCLPVFTRCNGVPDCTKREDEDGCRLYTCPGLHRCRGSDVCVLPADLCDGVLHCPQRDDERFCRLPCPDRCLCLGHAFVCRRRRRRRRPFDGRRYRQLRYLDARGSGMKLEGLAENVMLVYLDLAGCDVVRFGNVTLPNLIALDLSDNGIAGVEVSDLLRFKRLRYVTLSGNPLASLFAASQPGPAGRVLHALQALDLSRVKLQTLSLAAFAPFPGLRLLNLSQSGVKIVRRTDEHASLPTALRELDARGCDMAEFPRTLFRGLDAALRVVYADTYKLCCPAVLPGGFPVDDCHAPFDEISSCDSLLRSAFYRGALSVLAAFGLSGNAVSFAVRLCAKKSSRGSGFGVFVQHLCVSDFLMGVYLVFIGAADRLFSSDYLWQDTSWRRSAACKLAGFVSLASCEVSSFVICLITLDRFLVLRFPFSELRFGRASAQAASAAAWVVGAALAAVPLLPVTRSWGFYGQTGICIPLPVTRQEFAGRGYAFGVMIVLNFMLFVLIACGQVSIYASIQAGKMSDGGTSGKSHDALIARRLVTVAVSDFLCWFPVGLLGLLASNGTPVPGTVSVAIAIFVLPLNSTLNPFLYTLNMLQERLQRRKEARLLEMLMQQNGSKIAKNVS